MVNDAELRRAFTKIEALEKTVLALKLDILKIAQTHVETLENQQSMLDATNHLLDALGVPRFEDLPKKGA